MIFVSEAHVLKTWSMISWIELFVFIFLFLRQGLIVFHTITLKSPSTHKASQVSDTYDHTLTEVVDLIQWSQIQIKLCEQINTVTGECVKS